MRRVRVDDVPSPSDARMNGSMPVSMALDFVKHRRTIVPFHHFEASIVMKNLVLAITLAATAGSALAQLPKDTEVSPGSVAPADVTFIVGANRSNVAQMMLARTAAGKAKDGGVRTLAEAVTSTHAKANDALKLLAGMKHVDLPGQPDATQQAEVDRLTAMHGADSDRAYIDDLISDQDVLIAIYRDAQDHSEDPDIRRYASITLPSLQEHRRNASDLLARKPGA